MRNTDDYDIPVLRERMLAFLGGKADAYPHRTEERFPRILVRLIEVWGQPEGEAYLNDLLMTDRADRQGFPDDVASELFRLAMIHAALRPENTDGTGWSGSDDGEVGSFFGRRARR
ncbi:MAG: hypothetical protein LBI87_06960 [Candidatus Accumulibacter sp.]|jgi:hypothetical protein|nr:hypothetical protein [Accumulibacter sp.]